MPRNHASFARTVLVATILIAAVALAYFILHYEVPPADEAPSEATAPAPSGPEQIRLVTWNLLNLGGSKSNEEMAFIAGVLREHDVVAVQEVITSPEGAQAIARLDDLLDRTGAAWDYVVSEPTTGQGTERYAFLWKPSRLRLVGQPWLEGTLADPLDREPFLARFETAGGRRMLLASFHAVPRGKNPAEEVALLDDLHRLYADDHVLIMGDFNLAQSHYAFDELKALGYEPVLVGQRTSLRMQPRDGQHLANEYDNIFYETDVLRADTAGVIDFTGHFSTLKEARTISDHLPVFMEVEWE